MPEKPSSVILLVDDDPLILDLGRELLEHLGYRVETAPEASQALEIFLRQGADLVILDYQLPGPDGYQLLQELRALAAGVRVLVATGFLSARDAARLQQGGAQGIIYKPFRLAELQRQIEAALSPAPVD